MRPFGILLVFMCVIAPLFSFFQLANTQPNVPLAAQYFGVAALILMAFGQFIATKFRVVELIFGPLDKAYILHKWLGIIAVVTMLLHDSIGAEIKNLGLKGAWSDFGEDLGELGFNGILILVGISLVLFIPYNWWRWTHKLMGAFFTLSALHFVMIDKPFATLDPLGLYVAAICAIGVASYAITLLPMRLRRGLKYTVSDVQETGGASAITLTPVDRVMKFRAGQFAFFRFADSHMQEVHPFTISSAPSEDGALRITLKPLGNDTKRLVKKLLTGSEVTVQGPFGRFGASRGKTPQIWIAGGIGVTPFTALLSSWNESNAPVEFYYIFRGADNAAHLQELQNHAASLPNVALHIFDSTQGGRMTAEQIVEKTAFDLGRSKVLYCGPASLRNEMAKGLQKHGVAKRKFHFEEFEIRSDIWPLDQINDRIKPLLMARLRGWL